MDTATKRAFTRKQSRQKVTERIDQRRATAYARNVLKYGMQWRDDHPLK